MHTSNIPTDSFEFIAMCQALDNDALDKLYEQISVKIVGIQVQLEAVTPNPPSALWVLRAKTSLKWNTWRLQIIKQTQTTRQRKKHIEYQQSYAARFLETAKRLLDPDTFSIISDEANHKVAAGNANHPT